MTLPELHLPEWRPTKDTLHLYCQILGKVRLATTTPRNHWWNVPLYVDVRGLTTRRLHHGGTEFEITLDFMDDALVVQTGEGRIESFSLAGGLSVAGFDAHLHEALRNLGVDVAIQEKRTQARCAFGGIQHDRTQVLAESCSVRRHVFATVRASPVVDLVVAECGAHGFGVHRDVTSSVRLAVFPSCVAQSASA